MVQCAQKRNCWAPFLTVRLTAGTAKEEWLDGTRKASHWLTALTGAHALNGTEAARDPHVPTSCPGPSRTEMLSTGPQRFHVIIRHRLRSCTPSPSAATARSPTPP